MYTKEMIKDKLLADPKWLGRAILAIYAKQTEAEQASEATFKHNNVGFNGGDAPLMSSFAKQIQKKMSYGVPTERALSEKQIFIARKRMVKYAGQLAKIANKKI